AGTRAQFLREYPDTTVLPEVPPGSLARLAAPIARGGTVIGVFHLRRQGKRAFTAGEITLVETFAEQAAVAIENARLFEEVQAHNREQAEALEREQATADVLRVIAGSPESLDASLQAVSDTVARLCGAESARVWLRDGDYLVSGPSVSPAGIDDPFQPGQRIGPLAEMRGWMQADAVSSGRTI